MVLMNVFFHHGPVIYLRSVIIAQGRQPYNRLARKIMHSMLLYKPGKCNQLVNNKSYCFKWSLSHLCYHLDNELVRVHYFLCRFSVHLKLQCMYVKLVILSISNIFYLSHINIFLLSEMFKISKLGRYFYKKIIHCIPIFYMTNRKLWSYNGIMLLLSSKILMKLYCKIPLLG